jgi:LacI family transcriptional regulator
VPAGSHQAYVADEVGTSTPVVVVARPPVGLEADCVLVDDFGGAHAATARLVAEDHRRIGFLGTPPSVYTGSERYRGFCAALEEAGIASEEDYARRGQQDLAAAEKAATELLALTRPPTAVFCTNNRNTLGAYRAVRRAGAHTTLAGFDNFELADVLSVPVIVVAYDPDELGRQAARLLADRLPSPERPGGTAIPPRRVVVPTTLLSYAPDDAQAISRA